VPRHSTVFFQDSGFFHVALAGIDKFSGGFFLIWGGRRAQGSGKTGVGSNGVRMPGRSAAEPGLVRARKTGLRAAGAGRPKKTGGDKKRRKADSLDKKGTFLKTTA